MVIEELPSKDDAFELRLFLEELVCDICRMIHVAEHGVRPDQVRIRQEVELGSPNAFSDILIQVNKLIYLTEVDYGYTDDEVIESISRKFATYIPLFDEISKLVLLLDRRSHADWNGLVHRVKEIIPTSWELDIWDEQHLMSLVREHFDVEIDSFSPKGFRDIQLAIDRKKGELAFGSEYANEPLDATLLWQFGYWRLHDLFHTSQRNKRAILNPNNYRDVIVLFADLSGFSGYLHDTPSAQTVQTCLCAFYTKARHHIIHHGGMLCEFLGDAVLGLFGIPDHPPEYIERSFECARSVLVLGESITNEWQRQIDRIQPARGCHIGMAMGDLQIVSLRPFSRTHIGAVGDTINLAARLSSHAQEGQVVVSNTVHRNLCLTSQNQFTKNETIDAKNVGRIQAWTFDARLG